MLKLLASARAPASTSNVRSNIQVKVIPDTLSYAKGCTQSPSRTLLLRLVLQVLQLCSQQRHSGTSTKRIIYRHHQARHSAYTR